MLALYLSSLSPEDREYVTNTPEEDLIALRDKLSDPQVIAEVSKAWRESLTGKSES